MSLEGFTDQENCLDSEKAADNSGIKAVQQKSPQETEPDIDQDIDAIHKRLRALVGTEELKTWLKIDSRRSGLDLAVNWLSITLGLTLLCLCNNLAAALPAPAVMIAAFFLIGFGQYGLFILGHDGLHGCLHKNLNTNDTICRWLIYSPMFMAFEDGRRNHLEHHKRLGHADDPDRYLHRLSDKNSFLALLAFCLGIKTFVKTVIKVSPFGARLRARETNKNQVLESVCDREEPNYDLDAEAVKPKGNANSDNKAAKPLITYIKNRLAVAIWQLAILSLLLVLHLPLWLYLTHWILPIYFCVFLADEIRAFCDHAVPILPDESADAKRMVSYTPNLAEKIVFAPHSMHLHAEHHLFPRVPYYNRKQVHNKLKGRPEITCHKSYLVFLFKLFASLPLANESKGN
ncbi:MAG: fatty acid desaturase [Candidatus Obscuribacterales bacterium]|nr:fatty acid desaturase [Candidatus Obscuribacterales bacterium]